MKRAKTKNKNKNKNSKVGHSATPSVKASEEVNSRGPSLRTPHDFLDHELFDGILCPEYNMSFKEQN